MCYSSRVEADYRRYLRVAGGARLSYAAFMAAFQRRAAGAKIAFPPALEDSFLSGTSEGDQALPALIRQHREAQATDLQQKLFAQRARLPEAERKLAAKATKTAAESKRIALAKIESYRKALAGEVAGGTARIYPFHYAPVVTVLNGEPVVLPMRYHLRPAGAPASFDEDFDGCYNARRSSLTRFWRRQFGHSHGLALWDRFYEHVRPDGKDVVLEFTPAGQPLMAVACLVSHWTPPPGSDEPEFWSFAAVTDEPPPEVAAAGHDRCIVPLRPEHHETWLGPDPANLSALQAVLDDRERYFYEHRMAA
jgi:putative SOS response-associated peptidase YedK